MHFEYGSGEFQRESMSSNWTLESHVLLPKTFVKALTYPRFYFIQW